MMLWMKGKRIYDKYVIKNKTSFVGRLNQKLTKLATLFQVPVKQISIQQYTRWSLLFLTLIIHHVAFESLISLIFVLLSNFLITG